MRSFRVVQAKRWLLTISLILMAVEVSSQPIRFSTFYDSDNGAGLLEAVVLLDDGKLMAAGSNLNGSYSDGHHVLVDDDGSLLFEHRFTYSEMNYNTQSLIRTNEGTFFSSGYLCDFTTESPGYCDFYFSKLDETGDTLFTKVLARPDTSDFLLSMVQTRANKIMLIGWTYNDTMSGNADLLFITVDTLGNEVNRVVWGGSGTDYVHSGIVINEGGEVLMTGYTKSFGGSANGRTWSVKTDTIGNVLGHEEYSDAANNGSGIGICQSADGNFVISGGNSGFGGMDGDAMLLKIDSDGNQIWLKEYPMSGIQGLWAVVGLENGTIISCGVTDDGIGGSQAGWLIKTDEDGDTLWTRTFNPSEDGTDYLRNMLVLPNGDIVMVGFGRGENSTTQDGWILRVDSMGCLLEGCGAVGIEEQLVIGNEQFSIWPNPAENVLNIVSQMKMETVQLYDMQGRLVYRSAVGHLQEYGVDVSSLGVGMYVLEVRSTEGIQSVWKVMIQRP